MRKENYQQTLNRILDNNKNVNPNEVKQVLILHEEELANIGDWCIRFDKLKYLKGFLANATITINFTAEGTDKLSGALLKNNPNVQAITTKRWDEIDFEKYDYIISISYKEEAILTYLHDRYGELIQNDKFRVSVFTMSHVMLKPIASAIPVFPVHPELVAYSEKSKAPGELFVSKEEQQWADEWLKDKGLKEHEELYIILDSTTRRDKLLTVQVYFQWLMTILKRENVKLLIFDETNMGKERFYREFLGAKLMEKFIFSNGLSLREDISLLGSSNTKLVFGPCTGLMHCASSIYNNYVSNGLDINEAPVLITYTGKYQPDERHVYLWWANTPLVNVLVLRNRNGVKTMLMMDDLTDEQKVINDGLSCNEYTAGMITEFVNQKLLTRVAQTA